MAGIMSSVGTILRLVKNIEESDGVAKGTLKTLNDKQIGLIRADGSMMKLLDKYIVEPIAVVSDDLKDVEELDSILGLHADMFAAYYMQVFDVLRNYYGLEIQTIIDTLATDNGGLGRVIRKGIDEGIVLGKETVSVDNLLDDLLLACEDDKVSNVAVGRHPAGTNAHAGKRANMRKEASAKKVVASPKNVTKFSVGLSGQTKDLLIPNAIQRTIQVTAEVKVPDPVEAGKSITKTIVYPITIKLAVIFTSISNIVNSITTNGDEYSFSSRLDDYRSGAISLLDFLTASDLIKKYKERKLKDKDALLDLINSRAFSANSKALSNGFVGFEKFYNMYLLSPEAKISVERAVKAKLSSKGKEKFLEAGNGLSVTVVDPDYERIQLMVKDIRGTSDLSFRKAIKTDKNGSDYSEIIKALVASKPPAF